MTRRWFKRLLLAGGVIVGSMGVAHAQVDAGTTDAPVPAPEAPAPAPAEAPAPAPEEPAPPADPSPPADLPAAPVAAVSGLVEPRDPPEGRGRKTARVILTPVRGLWWLVWSPVRGFAWAYDRYAIQNRVRRIFFSEDGRVGLFPVFAYKSGFGITLGARLQVRELLSHGSRLQLTARYKGEFLQAYTLRHRTGRLFGPDVQIETNVGYETFPRSRFFGIGNGDQEALGTSGIL